MKKENSKSKRDAYTVRTSVSEAIIITIVSIIAFVGMVFVMLLPYIGGSIQDSFNGKNREPEKKTVISGTVKAASIDSENISIGTAL